MELTSSIEDYLEAINILKASGDTVRVKDIAKFLGVKMPSVNAALKTLKENNLIKHESYGHVELTDEGRKKANEIYTRHRLILQFIQEVLGVPYEIADEDACRVEHVLSQETIDSLAAFMNYMESNSNDCDGWLEDFRKIQRDRKIATRSESFIKRGLVNLTKVAEGKRFLVKGIDGGKAVMNRLATLGILPDTIATVIVNQSGQIILEIKGTRIALGGGIATKIWGRVR